MENDIKQQDLTIERLSDEYDGIRQDGDSLQKGNPATDEFWFSRFDLLERISRYFDTCGQLGKEWIIKNGEVLDAINHILIRIK